MSAQKPTPGPWEMKPAEDGVAYLRIRGTRAGCRYKICNVHAPTDMGFHPTEAEANARLIAEAGTVAHETGLTPRQLAEQRAELLEALEEIAEGCFSRRPGHIDYCRNRTKAQIEEIARAAIAKAIKP